MTTDDRVLALSELLHNLMAYLVISNKVDPKKMAGIVEISAKKLDADHPEAAKFIRGVFSGAQDEWPQMADLADHSKTAGSA